VKSAIRQWQSWAFFSKVSAMNNNEKHGGWNWPMSLDWPADPKKRKQVKIIRIAAVTMFVVLLFIPTLQLELGTIKNQRKAAKYDRLMAAGKLTSQQIAAGRPKSHKGAVNRWRVACEQFWQGKNIYLTPDQASKLPESSENDVTLHPNMPFIVILLSLFAMPPMAVGGLIFTILKIIAILLGVLATAEIVSDVNKKVPDWIIGVALAFSVLFFIGDIQHANTNGFVFAFVAAHLWLYRRGRDYAAGAMLAVAICIKMTPALFILYWLYQRNWKLLGGCIAAGILFAILVPAMFMGPAHYCELTHSWLDNLIFKGVGGAWYPVHINQSLPAVLGRYLLGDQQGANYLWNADDNPNGISEFASIAVANLSEHTVKNIIRLAQAALMCIGAYAIGWRRLPRTDGRRALGYGVVIMLMLLLNQRTWDHHAAPMLIAMAAGWFAIAYGNIGPAVRKCTFGMMLAAGLVIWLTSGDLLCAYGRLCGLSKPAAEDNANMIAAYGTDFWAFLLVFFSLAVLAVRLSKADPAYSQKKMSLSE